MAKKCQCSRLKRIRTNPDGTSSSSNPTCKFCLEKTTNFTIDVNLKEEPESIRTFFEVKPKEVVDQESKIVDQKATREAKLRCVKSKVVANPYGSYKNPSNKKA